MYKQWLKSVGSVMESRTAAHTSSLLKQVFEESVIDGISNSSLTKEDFISLLVCDDNSSDVKPRGSIRGYPTYPLYRELGHMFEAWTATGRCPVLDLQNFYLLDEKGYNEKREEIFVKVTSILQESSGDQDKERFRDIINLLGKRGMLDLLGMRKTVGSIEQWPPPRKILEATFNSLNSPKSASTLTVGARALTKHSHRDQTQTWWGTVTGSEAAKNEHALSVMNKIVDNATWINMHTLPHDVLVIEIRQEQGYGMRWTADGKQFRGFVEPQMVNGHEVGWRH